MNYTEDFAVRFNDKLIKDIVASNFKTAAIFEKYGVDFCCKGNRLLQAACEEKGIDQNRLIEELTSVDLYQKTDNERYNDWELGYLAEYIINNHHRYLIRVIPEIAAHLEKIANVHGKKHLFLKGIEFHFHEISKELLQHMRKEETVLFPLIKIIDELSKKSGNVNTNVPNIKAPITVMEREHDSAGLTMEKIRELSGNFTLPDDACNTFTVTYKELMEFEQDLHKHIFLENGILFPKAIEFVEQLKKRDKLFE
jgi:regulator of cell morphogenesis and NO signaling